MSSNEIEIICLCGDHITLTRPTDGATFIGYCLGCGRYWSLTESETPPKEY